MSLAWQASALNLSADIEQFNTQMLQPVKARILIEDVDPQWLVSDFQVRLAPRAMFDKMQIPRIFFLTKLDFAIKKQQGQWYIDVSSYDLVKEPYLSFVVELVLPSHRLYREYTLLFDAPSQRHSTAVPLPYQP